MVRIIEKIKRPSKVIIDRFKKVSPNELWHEIEFAFISSDLKLLGVKINFAAPAIEVKTPPDDSTIVYKILSMAQPSDVLVVDMQCDKKFTCWREIVTLTA